LSIALYRVAAPASPASTFAAMFPASIDYRHGHITITPDYDYRIASRYMSEPEAEAMLQRRSRRN
jgi:hypothetical protein